MHAYCHILKGKDLKCNAVAAATVNDGIMAFLNVTTEETVQRVQEISVLFLIFACLTC